ncbi:unnamed protein product [marine sediment metagenome]|uniref:Carbohydrate kinase FGGY N-terminal domain-containing protein n=1 Tax=marine sediment metagenome TaxID=412755 RepID=X0ZR88_9ZZZZ
MGYLLGLDIGTSGVKALLVSLEGKIISSKTVSYPLTPPDTPYEMSLVVFTGYTKIYPTGISISMGSPLSIEIG